MQRAHVLVAAGVLGLAVIVGMWLGAPSAEPPPVVVARTDMPGSVSSAESPSITVHVAGAVRAPGLVTLIAGDRVAHAIASAGGALGVADLSALNLAAPLGDGDQVTVPVKGEQTPTGLNPGAADDGLVDVNHASPADLENMPGVGPVLAKRIFDYRQEHGPFATVEDLLDVPGIGEGKLAALLEALVLR